MVFADAYGCWGFLDLWRIVPAARSTRPRSRCSRPRRRPMTAALRRCQARTFVAPAAHGTAATGPVVLTWTTTCASSGRTAAIAGLAGPAAARPSPADAVPASVFNVAAQLLAVEAGVDDHPPSTRGPSRRRDLADPASRPDRLPGRRAGRGDIVVTIEETSAGRAAGRCSPGPTASAARERELLGLLVTGADTRAWPRPCSLSEHTVQDHLKSIFAKTGARDRVTLLSRALGTGLAPAP